MLGGVEGPDGAVLRHKGVDEAFHKIRVFPGAGDAGKLQQGGHHAAVDIVPGGGLSLADLLDVPGGALGGGMGDQFMDILMDFFVHGELLLFKRSSFRKRE